MSETHELGGIVKSVWPCRSENAMQKRCGCIKASREEQALYLSLTGVAVTEIQPAHVRALARHGKLRLAADSRGRLLPSRVDR